MITDIPCEYEPLGEGVVKLNFGATDGMLSLLIQYIDEIELFNPAYGLVKVNDRRELIVKHLLDSLAPMHIIPRLLDEYAKDKPGKRKVADVGSGAGLPGIPLAVCMPDVEFTLIERMGRRAGFLRDALAILGLPNVLVEEAEMEKIAQNPAAAGSFDLVVSRAFRPLEPVILKTLLKFLTPGGTLAAYKGRREAVEEEMARYKTLPWKILPLEVPFLNEERCLLLINSGSSL